VLYCGIDPDPASWQYDPAAVRAEFGFTRQDIVFGHVGRFHPQKNHQFYLETAAEIRRLEPRSKFLLVGDGPLRPEMEARTRALGLQGCTVFAGARSDVPRLMASGMDLLLFPSLYEGLGIVLLEAQAAGLTALVSEGIPPEVVIHPALVRHLRLSIGPRDWARIACDAVKEPRFNLRTALDLFKSSPFGIDRCVQRLCDIYRSEIPSPLLQHQERGATIA
jgi:glycosyltransferase involved in cell wall biosynthesis